MRPSLLELLHRSPDLVWEAVNNAHSQDEAIGKLDLRGGVKCYRQQLARACEFHGWDCSHWKVKDSPTACWPSLPPLKPAPEESGYAFESKMVELARNVVNQAYDEEEMIALTRMPWDIGVLHHQGWILVEAKRTARRPQRTLRQLRHRAMGVRKLEEQGYHCEQILLIENVSTAPRQWKRELVEEGIQLMGPSQFQRRLRELSQCITLNG